MLNVGRILEIATITFAVRWFLSLPVDGGGTQRNNCWVYKPATKIRVGLFLWVVLWGSLCVYGFIVGEAPGFTKGITGTFAVLTMSVLALWPPDVKVEQSRIVKKWWWGLRVGITWRDVIDAFEIGDNGGLMVVSRRRTLKIPYYYGGLSHLLDQVRKNVTLSESCTPQQSDPN